VGVSGRSGCLPGGGVEAEDSYFWGSKPAGRNRCRTEGNLIESKRFGRCHLGACSRYYRRERRDRSGRATDIDLLCSVAWSSYMDGDRRCQIDELIGQCSNKSCICFGGGIESTY